MQQSNGVTTHQISIVHVCPVCNLIWIHGDEFAHLQSLDFDRTVVHPAMKAVAAESDTGKPDMLHLGVLDKGFLDLKIALLGRWTLKRGYERAHGFARRADGIAKLNVIIPDAKPFRIFAIPDHLPRDRVLHTMRRASTRAG